MHEEDRDFLKEIKTISDSEIRIYLTFQACEDWRRVALEREFERRLKKLCTE
jgi:hypothetical protein